MCKSWSATAHHLQLRKSSRNFANLLCLKILLHHLDDACLIIVQSQRVAQRPIVQIVIAI